MATDYNFIPLLIRGKDISAEEQKCVTRQYAEIGREALYHQMKKKKILPFAANTFAFCGLDRLFWQEILEQYRKRNRAILCYLDNVYIELDRQGVTKMFVSENFGALLSSGNDLALFASGDVDNYADPIEKEKIYRAFEVLGFTRKERYSGRHLIAAEFFPPQTEELPERFYISVDFYPLARLKLPCFVRADDFVDWDRVYRYGDTSVRLPPVDALTYICMLHISLHSFSRAPDIRLYTDLLNMSVTGVDYENIVRWSCRDHTCTRVATAAKLSNLLMRTCFPDKVIELSAGSHKLIARVYDTVRKDLRCEPRGLKVMLIEVLCHDNGVLHGVREILFPDKAWMKKVYGNCGVAAHCRHFMKVIH